MKLKDMIVDQHVNHVPKEIVCFNQWSIYKDISRAEKDFRELLKKDLTFNGIIGSDLPFKYWININIYTPYYQLKKDFKWKKKK